MSYYAIPHTFDWNRIAENIAVPYSFWRRTTACEDTPSRRPVNPRCSSVVVIAKRNSGISETFTVRRIAYGVGVEKTFNLHSPTVEKVETVRRGKVRRAKLYYLRDRVGKAAKTKEQVR